jgi:biotin carboxylase
MRVLILSTTTGYQLRSFGESAQRIGLELTFATDRCRTLDDPWRDDAVAVRFHEEAASLQSIVAAARRRPIDGVIAVGDRPVVLAARAAQALGLRGNPPDAVAASVNKKLAHVRFVDAGLPVPWFFEAAVIESIADDPRVRFPCVIKPLGLSGSRGVMRADSREQLRTAIARLKALLSRRDVRVLRSGLEDTMLVEGFIEGREFAIEGVMIDGRLDPFAIFDKPEPLDGPFFEETIYVTPSDVPRDQQTRIVAQVQRAASALGLTNGPIHAECRVGATDIFILEIAARPIGGLCSKVLRFSRAGASAVAPLEEVLLRHAIGEDIAGYTREPRAAGVMMIPIPKRGTLRRVDGIEEARAMPHVEEIDITAKTDQLLEPLPEGASYLGFIFVRAPARDAVVKALIDAHAKLRFDIASPLPIARV